MFEESGFFCVDLGFTYVLYVIGLGWVGQSPTSQISFNLYFSKFVISKKASNASQDAPGVRGARLGACSQGDNDVSAILQVTTVHGRHDSHDNPVLEQPNFLDQYTYHLKPPFDTNPRNKLLYSHTTYIIHLVTFNTQHHHNIIYYIT